ncbi:hypothetical protein AAMO2058_001500600 [Amorphochlora amoebiformis]
MLPPFPSRKAYMPGYVTPGLVLLLSLACGSSTTSPTSNPSFTFSRARCIVERIGTGDGSASLFGDSIHVMGSGTGITASASDNFLFLRSDSLWTTGTDGFTASVTISEESNISTSGQICLTVRNTTASDAPHASICARKQVGLVLFVTLTYRSSQATLSTEQGLDPAVLPLTLTLSQNSTGYITATHSQNDGSGFDLLAPRPLFPFLFTDALYGYGVSQSASGVFSDALCLAPTESPLVLTISPTVSPTRSPITKTPTTSGPNTPAPFTVSPTGGPTTISPTRSPVTEAPVTVTPSLSPVTAAPSAIGAPDVTLTPRNNPVSSTGRFRITALATPNPNSPSPAPADVLDYTWSVTYQAPFGETVTENIEGRESISISPEEILPGVSGLSQSIDFNFCTTIADTRGGPTREACVTIPAGPPPTITTVTVLPTSGTAYTTYFSATVAASSAFPPLSYQFLVNGKPLSGFQNSNNLQFRLPAGIAEISVIVRDSLGGTKSQILSPSLSVVSSTPAPTPAISTQACGSLNQVDSNLRTILGNIQGLSSTSSPSTPLETLTLTQLQAASTLGLNPQIVRTVELYVQILEGIPSSDQAVDDCTTSSRVSTLDSEFPEAQGVVLDAPAGTSFRRLAYSLWQLIIRAVIQAIKSVANPDGVTTGYVTQIVGALANATAAQLANSTEVADLANLVSSAINQTQPAILTDANVGSTASNVASTLLTLGLGNSTNQSTCEGVEASIALMDAILQRAGSGLGPSENAYTVSTPNSEGTTSTLLLDSSIRSLITSSVKTVISTAASDLIFATNPSLRESLITTLSVNTISNLTGCRDFPEGSVASPIASIILRNNSAPDEAVTTQNFSARIEFPLISNSENSGCGEEVVVGECRFWDTRTGMWNNSGCTTSGNSSAGYICTCYHLTEFAIVRAQQSQDDCTANSVAYLIAYLMLAGCYAFIILLVCRPLYRSYVRKANRMKKNMDGIIFDRVKATCLILQALLRIPLCVLLSGVDDDFSVRTVDNGVILVLLALPHCLMWAGYTVMIYQWAVIHHHSKINSLVHDLFSKHLMKLYILVAFSILTIWASFALFLYLPSSLYAGPVLMFALTFIFALIIMALGRATVRMMERIRSRKNKRKSSKRVRSLSVYVYTLGLLILAQAVTWLAAALIEGGEDGLEDEGLLVLFILYYVADIVVAVFQVDFLSEFACLTRTVKMVSIFTSTSKRSTSAEYSGNADSKEKTHKRGSTGPSSNYRGWARRKLGVVSRIDASGGFVDSKTAMRAQSHRQSEFDPTGRRGGSMGSINNSKEPRKKSRSFFTQFQAIEEEMRLEKDEEAIVTPKASERGGRPPRQATRNRWASAGSRMAMEGGRQEGQTRMSHVNLQEVEEARRKLDRQKEDRRRQKSVSIGPLTRRSSDEDEQNTAELQNHKRHQSASIGPLIRLSSDEDDRKHDVRKRLPPNQRLAVQIPDPSSKHVAPPSHSRLPPISPLQKGVKNTTPVSNSRSVSHRSHSKRSNTGNLVYWKDGKKMSRPVSGVSSFRSRRTGRQDPAYGQPQEFL